MSILLIEPHIFLKKDFYVPEYFDLNKPGAYLIIRHIAKIDASGLLQDRHNIEVIKRNKLTYDYYTKCLQEITNLSRITILGDITLKKMLLCSNNWFSERYLDDRVVDALELHIDLFNEYSLYISTKIHAAKRYKDVFPGRFDVLNNIFYKDLPYPAIEKICKNLMGWFIVVHENLVYEDKLNYRQLNPI